MHDSVKRWATEVLDPAWLSGKTVLEVGAFDINGSLRPMVEPYATYCGSDFRPGPSVNVVCPAEDLTGFFRGGLFDLVICTEMLEHAEDWKGSVLGMKSMLRIGGRILLTTRGPGAGRHAYPDDHWRFTKDDLRTAFAEFDILRLDDDPDSPGVFLYARRTGDVSYPAGEPEEAPP